MSTRFDMPVTVECPRCYADEAHTVTVDVEIESDGQPNFWFRPPTHGTCCNELYDALDRQALKRSILDAAKEQVEVEASDYRAYQREVWRAGR